MPQAVQRDADEAELPGLGAEHRRTGRALGIGTARRLGRQDLAPLQVAARRLTSPFDSIRRPTERGWRDSERRASVTRKRTASAPSPAAGDEDAVAGLGAGEHVGEHQAGVRRAGLADGERERIGELRGRRASCRARSRRRRAGSARRARPWRDRSGATFAFVEHASAPPCRASGPYACVSAKRSSQVCAKRSSGRAPGVEELARQRRRRLDLRDHVLRIRARTPRRRRRSVCSALPSGAASRQSAIATSAVLGAAAHAVGALQQRAKARARASR